MDNQHSLIAPSAAHIWGAPDGCTGYPTMAAAFPQLQPTEDTLTGDAVHELGLELANWRLGGSVSPKFCKTHIVGTIAKNGILLTEELYDVAEIYADDIHFTAIETGIFDGDQIGFEQKIYAPQIHSLSYGTLDSFIFDKKNLIVYLWELKNGHDYVDEFECWQTINYSCGLIHYLLSKKLIHIEDVNALTFHMRIVQPRAYHRDGPIREWKVTAKKLQKYFIILHKNAHKALSPQAELRTGPHCKNCPARLNCEPAIRAGTQLYEASAGPMPIYLDNQALGIQLAIVSRAVEHLTALKKAYTEQITYHLKNDKIVPGWILTPHESALKWVKPVSEITQLGKYLGVDLIKKELITPTQAITAGIPSHTIEKFARRFTSKKLVSDRILKKIFKNEV